MRTHVVQTSFLTGVLDPRAKARVETDSYNNALLEGENVTPSHLGGVRRRPGLAHIRVLPYSLTRTPAGTVTAPSGGTAADAADDDETTALTTSSTASTTDPLVVVHYDAGSARTVTYADVIGIKLSAGATTEFCIQYSTDDVAWTRLGAAFEAVDYQDERSFRRVGPVTARYWRVAKVGGTDIGSIAVTVKDFLLWEENSTVSATRLIPWEVSATDRYCILLADRSALVYHDFVLVAELPMPYASADLAGVDATSDAETLVLVHEDYPPRFVLREDVDHFQTQQIVFDTVPQFDFNDADSPTPTSEIQVVTFVTGGGSWSQGNRYQIELEGAKSGEIVFGGDSSTEERETTAENLARGVQDLYTVNGTTGVSAARTGSYTYTVTFAGASAGSYKLLNITPLAGSGTASITRTQAGTARTEDAWSAVRGYPRTVAFYQGRLYFGGTKQRQQTLFGSTVNDTLDFEQGEGLDDEPINVTLVGQQLNAITGLFSGRQLQIFTTGGEFRFAKQQGEAITPGDAPAFQTGYGAAKIRPVSIDGSTIFVQRLGKSLRDFKFNYEEDAYDSLGVSALASHLINDVADLFAWNGSRTDEIGLVFAVNGDGTLAVMNSRKEANIQAWTVWTTAGEFKSGAAILDDMYFVIERTLNGVTRRHLEYASDEHYLDCAVLTTGSDLTTITGLGHLDGVECRVRADGFTQTNVTPAGGEATVEAADVVEIGLGFSPVVTPMPLNVMMPSGANVMRRRRIVKVRVKVNETLGLIVNGRVIPDRNFDVDSLGAAAAPYSGNHSLEETTNWDETEDKIVRFTQVDPLPFEILGVDVQMESSE